jgi:hypothetical protein
MCSHTPQCPAADSVARTLAVVIADHHEQGWTLLCNGVIHFDDGADLLPSGAVAGNRILSAAASPRQFAPATRTELISHA